MAIAEKIIERRTTRSRHTQIVTLERQLHERRVSIKGLLARITMFGTLATNGLMSQAEFATERKKIFEQINALGHGQGATRKKLKPYKAQTEKKGKSPYKKIPEGQSAIVFDSSNSRHNTTAIPMRIQHRTSHHPIITRRELMNMRKSGQISRAEYNSARREQKNAGGR